MSDPNVIIAVLFAIIGFFLRGLMSELKDVKRMALESKGKLDVLQNDHDNKNKNVLEKHSELKTSIDKLTDKIEVLTDKIK